MTTTVRYPKRLIEVDLPIKRISAHARREKSIRHGHISTLHIWWARRPLAACRAVILAALFPDPADPDCPPRFLEEARKALERTKSTSVNVPSDPKVRWDYSKPEHVRAGLLDFIAEFANWDNSTNKDYLAFARRLVHVAHESLGGAPGTRPLVVDPFAGGGSIPLEALRIGAGSFAADLNPVAVLLNRVVLDSNLNVSSCALMTSV
jgi:adenine-specific DNA methylase